VISIQLIKDNLQRAEELIADTLALCGSSGREVRIMAVTKTHPVDVVSMAIDAGIALIGENRVSEGGRKIKTLGKDSAEFHMIGPVHKGEVRQTIRDFQWIDSIGRMKIIHEIARRTAAKGIKQPGILLEVNTSGEESKHGFRPDLHLLEDVLGQMKEMDLMVSGLMTVGPLGGDETDISRAFALLGRLKDDLNGSDCGHNLSELSMGMSDDFQAAVKEGSTLVRLGRYLFGPRQSR